MSSAESQRLRKHAKALAEGRVMRTHVMGRTPAERAAHKLEYKHQQRVKDSAKQGRVLFRRRSYSRPLHDSHVGFYLLHLAHSRLRDAHVRCWERANKPKKKGRGYAKEVELSLSFLRSVLSYEPETGLFRWLINESGAKVGTVAGNVKSNGYFVVGLRGAKYQQHRLAWFYHYGVWPIGTIDHRDCDRANNRMANLRDVSQAVNMQNQRKATSRSKSGVLGVYWSEKHQGFMAALGINKKKKRRGPYKTQERAAAVYLDLKRTHHEGCTL